MPITSQQQYADYGLIVPRPTVRFRDVSDLPGVRVEPVSGIETKVKPVVRTSGEDYDFEGVTSGERSGLLNIGVVTYKIKGCRIEEALGNGLYRRRYGDTPIPRKGNLSIIVEMELDNTRNVNNIFTKEGFAVPYEPEAIIHYGVMFSSDLRPRWLIEFQGFVNSLRHEMPDVGNLSQEEVGKMLYQRGLEQDELAASVMKIKGDTRIPALYGLKVQNYEAASAVAYRLSLIAGAQRRITEDKFVWEDSEHVGNYVLWMENRQLHLSMVDFEATTPYNGLKNQLSRFSYTSAIARRLRTDKEIGRVNIIQSPARSDLSRIEGIPRSGWLPAPNYFRKAFTRGFKDGHKNPDKREPIPLEMLVRAFDLRNIVLN